MDFLEDRLLEYIEQHTRLEPAVLQKLNKETYTKVLTPRMLAGHLQGRVLAMFSKMIQPKQVLEIGTYTGYSAICWTEGLKQGGMVHTIDINEELEEMVMRYLEEAGVTQKVKTYIGNAMDVIASINEEFDIVYIDADKVNYSNYFDLVFPKVRSGGFIIADNVLWSGKVIDPENEMDEDTRAIVQYCKKVTEDERVENVLFPIRDGLMVARKLI